MKCPNCEPTHPCKVCIERAAAHVAHTTARDVSKVDAEEIRDLIRRGVSEAFPNIYFQQRNAVADAVMRQFAASDRHKIITIGRRQRPPFVIEDDNG